MVNFLRQMGIREFPYTTVGVWIFLGLMAALAFGYVFRESITGRLHIHFGLVIVGAFIGGFLGFCFHMLVENCYLGSW